MKQLINKITYYILYPFWYFFSKTLIGQAIWGFIICTTFVGVIIMSVMEFLEVDDKVMSDCGVGIGIFSLLCAPIIAGLGELFDFWMEHMRENITGISFESRTDW